MSLECHEDSVQGSLPLVLVHGFMGAPCDWDGIAGSLGARPTLAVDLCATGRELLARRCDPTLIDISTLAGGVHRRVMSALPGSTSYDICGYSLGGRVALEMLARQQQWSAPRIRRACLVSATAGIEESDLRSQRCDDDDRLAHQLHGISNHTDRQRRTTLCRQFLDEWYSQGVFGGLLGRSGFTEVLARRADALADSDNLAIWAAILSGCSQGRAPSRWETVAAEAQRISLVVGSNDAKYCAVAARAGDLGVQVMHVGSAAHALLHEQPGDLACAIRAQLACRVSEQLEAAQ